jgi:hypothetical protein
MLMWIIALQRRNAPECMTKHFFTLSHQVLQKMKLAPQRRLGRKGMCGNTI